MVIGAPKAGSTALHAALAQHPGVFTSQPKEPKFWLCDGAPPPAWTGPGDRHSQQAILVKYQQPCGASSTLAPAPSPWPKTRLAP
jgi:hypothetical protein